MNIAKVDYDDEFTVQDVVEQSRKELDKPLSASHLPQMLVKNRHGKYSFAVPLFGQFVLRQMQAA